VKFDDVQEFIEKRSSEFITLTKEELESLIEKAASKAAFEQRKWYENTQVMKDIEDEDDFYRAYAYESAELKPYQRSSGELTKNELRTMESFLGFRISKTGDVLPSGNKYLNQDQIALIQDATYLRVHTDPLAKSIVQNLENFIIGRGIQVDCAVPAIERAIVSFRRKHKLDRFEKQMVRHTIISGEFFTKIKVSKKDKDCYMFGVPPQNVLNIEYNDENLDDAIAFQILMNKVWKESGFQSYDDLKEEADWFPSIDYEYSLNQPFKAKSQNEDKFVKDTYIHFIKLGNFDEVRGRPPFQSILKSLKYASDFTIDRMRLNHERAKVIMKKKVTGNASGYSQKPQVAPRGGIILIETENITYDIMKANIDSADAKEDGLWILYYIGSGVVLPIHILQQRGDQQVYASIKKMDTPFSQNIFAWQDFFDSRWDELYKFIIRKKVEAGELKPSYRVPAFIGMNSGRYSEGVEFFQELNYRMMEMVKENYPIKKIVKEIEGEIKDKKMDKKIMVKTEDIPIVKIFPEVVKENPLEMSKILFLHRKMGLVSLATAARKAGYDWRAELSQMSYEKNLDLGFSSNDDLDEPSFGDERDGNPNIKSTE